MYVIGSFFITRRAGGLEEEKGAINDAIITTRANSDLSGVWKGIEGRKGGCPFQLFPRFPMYAGSTDGKSEMLNELGTT